MKKILYTLILIFSIQASAQSLIIPRQYNVGKALGNDFQTLGACFAKLVSDASQWAIQRQIENNFIYVNYFSADACGERTVRFCRPNSPCIASVQSGGGFDGFSCYQQNSCEDQNNGLITPIVMNMVTGTPRELYCPKVKGSVIDYYKKTVSEQIPIDGSDVYLTYSSEFNPKRNLNSSFHEEVKFTTQPTDQFLNLSVVSAEGLPLYSSPFLNQTPVVADWVWDQQTANRSTHPALSKGTFNLSIDKKTLIPMTGVNPILSDMVVNIINNFRVTVQTYTVPLANNSYAFNDSIYQSNKTLTTYKPAVWGLHGWTLSHHHYFDKETKVLFSGTGDRIDYKVVRTINLAPYGSVDVVSSHFENEIFIFDPTGQHLETRTKLLGKTKYKFNYDSNRKLLSFVDINNKTTNIIYNADGSLAKITAPFGQETIFAIQDNRITEAKNSLQKNYLMQYDANTSLLKQFTKPNLEVTTFNYDLNGNFIEETKNTNKNQGFSEVFLSFTRAIAKATSTGIKQIVESNQISPTITEITTKDGNSNVINITSNSNGGKVVQTNNNISTYNPVGDPMWGSFVNSVPNIANYQEAGHNITVREFNNTIYNYANSTNPTTLTSVQTSQGFLNQERVNTNFDVSSKSLTITDTLNRISKVYLNDKEQITRIEPAIGFAQDITYNSNGQIDKVAKGSTFENYSYDQYGHLSSITNAKNQTTSFIRDPQGKVLTKILPNQDQINFEYTDGNELKKIITSNNQVHNFQMDLGDYIKQYINSDNKTTFYNYDDDKRLSEISKPSGNIIIYNYKPGTNNIQNITTSLGTYNYTTDPQSRLTQTISPDNIKTDITWLDGNMQQQKTYDSDGSVIATLTNRFETNRQRINQIQLNNTTIASYAYNPSTGKIQTLTAQTTPFFYFYEQVSNSSDQIHITNGPLDILYISQDNQNGDKPTKLVTGTITDNPNLQLFISMRREFDNYGQASDYAITTTKTANNVLNSFYQLVPQYDENNRLIEIQKNRKNFINNQVTSTTDFYNKYNYPQNSNNNVKEYTQQILPSANPTKRTIASHSPDDKLLNLRGSITRDYTYDDDGNIKTMTNCYGTITYEYDDFSNLKKVTLQDGKVIEYKVDGLNRRVKKLVNGVTKEYYIWYDQTHLAAILDQNKVAKLIYIYGPESNSPSYVIKDNITYRILHDPGLDSIRYIVNKDTRQIVQEIEYDEYGNTMKNTNVDFQPLSFAGGLSDQDTKFIRFGARDYDPTVGRWTTKDPIGFAGGDTNLYAYVGGNPMSAVDPSGLKLKFSSKEAESVLRPVLDYLEKSPEGARLIQMLDRSSQTFNLSIDDNNNPHQQGSNVCVDPNSTIYINTDKGIQAASLPRILAHELGHLTGSKDDGLLNMNNVNKFENPIMFPLEGFNRTGY